MHTEGMGKKSQCPGWSTQFRAEHVPRDGYDLGLNPLYQTK